MDTKNSINTSPVEISGRDEVKGLNNDGSLFEVQRRLTSSEKNMLAGGFAGSIGKTATAPFSRLTVLYQVSSLMKEGSTSSISSITTKDSLHVTLLKIIRKEGITSPWKGNFTSVIHRFPYSAINFAVYEKSKALLMRYRQCSEDTVTRFICGSAAGGVACFLCYPLDIVRTRLTVSDTFSTPQQLHQRSVDNYKIGGRIGKVIGGILKQEGIIGLYRGLNISLMVAVPTLATSFTVYGFVKEACLMRGLFTVPVSHTDHSHRRLEDQYGRQLSVTGSLVCGSISGLISSAVIFPADVIRKRMQVMGLAVTTTGGKEANSSTSRFVSNSTFDHCRHLLRTEGVAGFYRGILPELLKVCPMVAITFCSYELSKDYLNKHF